MTGSLTFDEFMELALYDPRTGFFGSTGVAEPGSGSDGVAARPRAIGTADSARGGGQAGGSHGHFITSPETGPLFGLLVARFLHSCWEHVGRPDRFEVVEYAAGRGALAITIRSALEREADLSALGPALRYHMVERSEPLRAAQSEHLAMTDPAAREQPLGPLFHSHADSSTLPSAADVVLANELLDNIPVALFERVAVDHPTEPDWLEVMVSAPPCAPEHHSDHTDRHTPTVADRHDTTYGPLYEDDRPTAWREHLRAGRPDDAAVLRRLAPDAPIGARVPLQTRSAEWLTDALDLVGSTGTVVVIDYCRNTADMALVDQSEWLRTYRGHQRSGSPLDAPGSRDITCDVAPDQLGLVRRPGENLSQAEWLARLGIDSLVDEGRTIWAEKASAPDLEAIRARSRINEAEALCDPRGLGAFRVLIW